MAELSFEGGLRIGGEAGERGSTFTSNWSDASEGEVASVNRASLTFAVVPSRHRRFTESCCSHRGGSARVPSVPYSSTRGADTNATLWSEGASALFAHHIYWPNDKQRLREQDNIKSPWMRDRYAAARASYTDDEGRRAGDWISPWPPGKACFPRGVDAARPYRGCQRLVAGSR
jgi:hypothetical protein